MRWAHAMAPGAHVAVTWLRGAAGRAQVVPVQEDLLRQDRLLDRGLPRCRPQPRAGAPPERRELPPRPPRGRRAPGPRGCNGHLRFELLPCARPLAASLLASRPFGTFGTGDAGASRRAFRREVLAWALQGWATSSGTFFSRPWTGQLCRPAACGHPSSQTQTPLRRFESPPPYLPLHALSSARCSDAVMRFCREGDGTL